MTDYKQSKAEWIRDFIVPFCVGVVIALIVLYGDYALGGW